MAEFEPGAVAPVVDTPVVANTTPTQDVTATPDVQNTPEPEPEKMLPQSQVDKIIQKEKARAYRQAEREAQQREERIRREVEERVAKSQPQAPVKDGKPQPSQFQDWEQFTEALTDWKLDQRMSKFQQETQAQQAQRQSAERAREVLPKVKTAMEKYDDFNDVATSFDAPPAMQAAMLDSDITGELYYYLGSNPNELARIASLPEIKQVKAISELEAKLSAPQPVTPKPPAPITPSNANSTVKKDLADLPWKEFVKERRKQVAGRR